jgi:hypothetical protein
VDLEAPGRALIERLCRIAVMPRLSGGAAARSRVPGDPPGCLSGADLDVLPIGSLSFGGISPACLQF